MERHFGQKSRFYYKRWRNILVETWRNDGDMLQQVQVLLRTAKIFIMPVRDRIITVEIFIMTGGDFGDFRSRFFYKWARFSCCIIATPKARSTKGAYHHLISMGN